MSNYWVDRATEQARKQYDKSLEDLEKELARYYKIALKGVRTDTVALFQKIHDEMEKGRTPWEQIHYTDTTDSYSYATESNRN